MLAHALCALIGFGALGTTGAYAQAVTKSENPYTSEALQRFFRPGHNLASAMIGLVPLLGAGLLFAQHGKDAHLLYPWIGLVLWIAAAGIATGLIWPAEHKLQLLLASRRAISPHAPSVVERGELAVLARQCLLGATLTTACFLAAFVVMIAQP
jgi:hypothetical protein